MRPLVIVAALIVCAACTGAVPAASPRQPTAPATIAATATARRATPTPPATPASMPPTPVAATPAASLELPDLVGEVPEQILLQIMQQVAASTGAPLADLEIEEARAVTWNDGSLGCPEPGQLYTQALVDGYWVVIEVAGETFDFRVGANGEFKFCPPGRGEPPADLPD
jgi:hypothetical protein